MIETKQNKCVVSLLKNDPFQDCTANAGVVLLQIFIPTLYLLTPENLQMLLHTSLTLTPLSYQAFIHPTLNHLFQKIQINILHILQNYSFIFALNIQIASFIQVYASVLQMPDNNTENIPLKAHKRAGTYYSRQETQYGTNGHTQK